MVVEELAVERLALERLAVERLAVEDLAAEDLAAALVEEPELAFFDALELAFDRELVREAVDAFCVIAVRSLSKSLSACLFVFAASRRSAVNAAVTSL